MFYAWEPRFKRVIAHAFGRRAEPAFYLETSSTGQRESLCLGNLIWSSIASRI
ncbi:hypothetical protein [Kistimonas asteriae]|uniref:hypothetical protein n=1 Tax=Kistimonas asteriae TaxID=517724 RepID=UPI001BAA7F58